MKTHSVALCAMLGLSGIVSAEPTLPDPGGRASAPFTSIISDYGPRNFSNQTMLDSNPHKGIDYAISGSVKGYAVESGEVVSVSLTDKRVNSYIKIKDWLYIHISTQTRLCEIYGVGEMGVDFEGKPVPKTNVLVLRGDVSGTLRTVSVFGPQSYDFLDPLTGDEKAVVAQVSSGSWVFLANNLANHLHLQRNSGEENPLKYVLHRDDVLPKIIPKYKYVNPENKAVDFVDDVVFNAGVSPVILQSGVDVAGDKDLGGVEISVLVQGSSSPVFYIDGIMSRRQIVDIYTRPKIAPVARFIARLLPIRE